jgi:hypothetical protein
MNVNYLTAPLETLTIAQLFARQAQANHDYERALLCRNQHPTISAEWDLWNAVGDGFMIDLVDIAKAITKRIGEMQAEAEASRGARTFTEGWACTTCGEPVMSTEPGIWHHKTRNDDCQVVRLGGIIKARVDA